MRQQNKHNPLSLFLGFSSVLLSLYFLLAYRTDLTIVAASIFFALICLTDCWRGKIPNLLNACLLLAGFGLNTYARGWTGSLFSLSGLGLGVLLLLLPYLMGGFGAGDVKALGALGALIGPYDLLHVFVYMAFWGGGFALLYNLFRSDVLKKLSSFWSSVKASALTRDLSVMKSGTSVPNRQFVRFPYAAAIAFGYYTFVIRGGVL